MEVELGLMYGKVEGVSGVMVGIGVFMMAREKTSSETSVAEGEDLARGNLCSSNTT